MTHRLVLRLLNAAILVYSGAWLPAGSAQEVHMARVLPGSTIGILGGGQLARMSALAARQMGYGVHILDPDPRCCAAAVADRHVIGGFDDAAAAETLAQGVDVVTCDIEKISPTVAVAVAARVPLRPGAHILHMVQDKGAQKDWLSSHGFAVGAYASVDSAEAIAHTVAAWGAAGRLKLRVGGYDGRGQAMVPTPTAAPQAFASLHGSPCVLEQEIALKAEFSLLVARNADGDVVVYPPAQNWHVQGQLYKSVMPASVAPDIIDRAQTVTRALAEALTLEGILAVEFFLSSRGEVTINELAPRPHNTYHAADMACVTSQFEQHIRAVCNLPLGACDLVRPTALLNILGDLWHGGHVPRWEHALRLKSTRLFLYGKQPRPSRKVGHLLASGEDAQAALAQAETAFALLR